MNHLWLLTCILGCQQALFVTAGFAFHLSVDVLPNLRRSAAYSSTGRSRRALRTDQFHSETQEGGTDVQWELFKQHHVGSWKGLWTTYDAMGDKLLESAAVVDNALSGDKNAVEVAQSIIQESVSADCPTCFDSSTTKDLPKAIYDATVPDWSSQYRLKFGANGMVVGPKVLKTGASTFFLSIFDLIPPILLSSGNRISFKIPRLSTQSRLPTCPCLGGNVRTDWPSRWFATVPCHGEPRGFKSNPNHANAAGILSWGPAVSMAQRMVWNIMDMGR